MGDADRTATSLKTSLESTVRGLSLFANSLEKAGFASSLAAYRQMRVVLLQQRLWSDRLSRTELQGLWDDLARESERVHRILAPFVEIMRELMNVHQLKSIPGGGD